MPPTAISTPRRGPSRARCASASEQSARTAVERLVALAVDREADALLLAGDLFDRDLRAHPDRAVAARGAGRGHGRRRHRDRRDRATTTRAAAPDRSTASAGRRRGST